MLGKKITVFDVGGTKARGAQIRLIESGSEIEDTTEFKLKEFQDFESVLKLWFKDHEKSSELIVGVAGPVDSAQETLLTNLSLLISKAKIQKQFSFLNVTIVNDMTLQCYGVMHAQPAKVLQPQKLNVASTSGNKAVLALGTGLGQGYITWQDHKYSAHGCEGGHATFAPETERDWELAQFLRKRFSHVSWERVVSGKEGFKHILEFFLENNLISKGHYLNAINADDSCAQDIVRLALEKDPVALSIVHYMLELLAREAGNFALKIMARGGIYLTGGVMNHLNAFLDRNFSEVFLNAFSSKNRFKSILQQIPIYVITDPLVALRGAHCILS